MRWNGYPEQTIDTNGGPPPSLLFLNDIKNCRRSQICQGTACATCDPSTTTDFSSRASGETEGPRTSCTLLERLTVRKTHETKTTRTFNKDFMFETFEGFQVRRTHHKTTQKAVERFECEYHSIKFVGFCLILRRLFLQFKNIAGPTLRNPHESNLN